MEPAEDILETLKTMPKASLEYSDVNALVAQLEKAYQCIGSGRNELAITYVRQCLSGLEATLNAIESVALKEKLSSPSPGM